MLADLDPMLRQFLSGFTAWPIVNQVPASRPDRFVLARATGGNADNMVLERAVVTVSVASTGGYADARLQALTLRDALLTRYTSMPLVRGVSELTRPYLDPDPDTGDARATFVHQMSVRATH